MEEFYCAVFMVLVLESRHKVSNAPSIRSSGGA